MYKARALRTSELLAIKIINLADSDGEMAGIMTEIELLRQCDHPNIVRYFGSYRTQEYLWVFSLSGKRNVPATTEIMCIYNTD